MASGFTTEEIKRLESEFADFLPPEPSLAHVENAPRVKRLAFAGTELGMLLHVDMGKDGRRTLFLNPIVARTLMEGIAEAGIVHAWWPKLENRRIPLAPDLTRADLNSAEQVRSIRTANVPKGALVVCGSERGTITLFLRPNFAAAVAWSIDSTGKRAAWWDLDYGIIPKPDSLN